MLAHGLQKPMISCVTSVNGLQKPIDTCTTEHVYLVTAVSDG